MLTYPAAVHKPLGPQTEPRMTGHDIVCLHTMAGYLSSTDRYFRAANGAGYIGTESHFGVGGRWGGDARAGLDGTVWQWQDLMHQADANRHQRRDRRQRGPPHRALDSAAMRGHRPAPGVGL